MNKKKLIIIISVLLIIIAVVATIFMTSEKNGVKAPVSSGDPAKNYKFSQEEVYQTIVEIAKDRFGDDAFVIPLTPDGPSEANIHEKTRFVYIYVADSLSKQEDVDNIKGIYHVDASTGEIFDNGNGKMEQLFIGE